MGVDFFVFRFAGLDVLPGLFRQSLRVTTGVYEGIGNVEIEGSERLLLWFIQVREAFDVVAWQNVGEHAGGVAGFIVGREEECLRPCGGIGCCILAGMEKFPGLPRFLLKLCD